MFDSEVAELLKTLNATFPPVQKMGAAEARAIMTTRRQEVLNVDDVERTEDREVPGPNGPVPVRIYFPRQSRSEVPGIIVFFHGGGFVFCDIESHDGFCREMAKETSSIVISVDYRLGPEHKAPAASQDAYAALVWAAQNADELGGDASRILTAGDSAGGNLAASVCHMARDAGGPTVAGQVLLYPMLDPSGDTESYRTYATGYFNTEVAMRWYWQQYLPDGQVPAPTHHVAPLTAPSMDGLPRAVVVTAGWDPLLDEGKAYAAALKKAGVPVVYRQYAGLIHGFLTMATLGAARSGRTTLWRDVRQLLTADEKKEVHA